MKSAIVSVVRVDRPGLLSSKGISVKQAGDVSPGPSPVSTRKITPSSSRAVSPSPSVTSMASVMKDLSDVVMESDYDSATSSGRKRKRERGRPPTTGEYVKLQEAKQRLREEEKKEEQWRLEKAILNPTAPLSTGLQAKALNLTARYTDELRDDLAASLAAVALQKMQKVLKMASSSKGLKGTFINSLKESACKTSACLTNLMTRVDSVVAESPAAKTDKLRQKLNAAEKEIARLKDDIAAVKAMAAANKGPSSNTLPKGQWQSKNKNAVSAHFDVESETPFEEVPPAIRPVLRGRRKILSPPRSQPRTQYRFEEEENPLLSRLDHLFERWCERKWGRDGTPLIVRSIPKE
ncbi:hypothetical protein PUN28_000527 [Cardiocondyla obscurior]|uniref:Uncharacterized protein n=1 Tax=Cardiocondyla obscurior TaxID=286306 RepID=A0AAW2H0G0_9HYME